MKIKYSEHNFSVIIESYKPIGAKLIGMREGKPFLRKGKLMINVNEQLCEVTKATFIDKEGSDISIEEANLDTDERISGVFVKNGKVLLLHRIKRDREYYVFPGGHKTKNESDAETLKREMKEELNVEISKDVELMFELDRKGFGKERYYRVDIQSDLNDMYKENADKKKDEVNEAVFLSIKKASGMDNVFPREVIELLNK